MIGEERGAAWRRGHGARGNGRTITENPYPAGLPEFEQWQAGWLEKDRQVQAAASTASSDSVRAAERKNCRPRS